ncbi:hypothetical protein RB195_008048 [Necator americanus]|uniref:Uncharacterized protein n=1 Tax=Necator americanus TaxID=51031 RepID=A0ABR1C1C1_NECAM
MTWCRYASGCARSCVVKPAVVIEAGPSRTATMSGASEGPSSKPQGFLEALRVVSCERLVSLYSPGSHSAFLPSPVDRDAIFEQPSIPLIPQRSSSREHLRNRDRKLSIILLLTYNWFMDSGNVKDILSSFEKQVQTMGMTFSCRRDVSVEYGNGWIAEV